MSQQNKLVKAQNGNLTIAPLSQKSASGVTASRMLDLAAVVTGYKEITNQEVALWLKQLEPYPANAIEKAFEDFLAESEFFPKPVQILALLNAGAEEARAQRDADKTKAMLEENRQIRARLEAAGLPSGIEQYHGIIQRAREAVRKL